MNGQHLTVTRDNGHFAVDDSDPGLTLHKAVGYTAQDSHVHEIIVCSEEIDPVACHMFKTFIEGMVNPAIRLGFPVGNLMIVGLENVYGAVGRAAVNDDKLFTRIVLVANTVNAALQRSCPVVHRHDYRNMRLRVHKRLACSITRNSIILETKARVWLA